MTLNETWFRDSLMLGANCDIEIVRERTILIAQCAAHHDRYWQEAATKAWSLETLDTCLFTLELIFSHLYPRYKSAQLRHVLQTKYLHVPITEKLIREYADIETAQTLLPQILRNSLDSTVSVDDLSVDEIYRFYTFMAMQDPSFVARITGFKSDQEVIAAHPLYLSQLAKVQRTMRPVVENSAAILMRQYDHAHIFGKVSEFFAPPARQLLADAPLDELVRVVAAAMILLPVHIPAKLAGISIDDITIKP